MDRIALKRQGRPDLVFDGFLVAHIHESGARSGSLDLAIYRTRTGKFILASRVDSPWPGSMEHDGPDGLYKALSFACADDVCLFLEDQGEDQGTFADANASLLRRAAQSDAAFRSVPSSMAMA